MLPRAAQTRVSLALCWRQEQYCVALLEKEHEVGCRWQRQAAASVCAGTGLRQACHVLQGILVLPLLGLSDPFSFQVDRREHHS